MHVRTLAATAGSIPTEIGHLTRLDLMNLGKNQLTGALELQQRLRRLLLFFSLLVLVCACVRVCAPDVC